MPDFAYAPPRSAAARKSLSVRRSGRAVDDQGASYSAAILLHSVVDAVIDILYLAPRTVSRVFPNVELVASRSSQRTIFIPEEGISDQRLREIDRQYWAAFGEVRSSRSEAGS